MMAKLGKLVLLSLLVLLPEEATCRQKNDQRKEENLDVRVHCDRFLFENSVKRVFNSKKNAIVRVVCVSRPENNGKNDLSSKQVLAGTGFFVSSRSHILTTASVVKNAQKIWVDFQGASYPAECIGVDGLTNVAVLKLLQSPSNFEIISLSTNNSSSSCANKDQKLSEIGSFVVFVGCKLGMDPLPELGNISGKNISYSDNEFLTTYLRTSLMFCGGESGAPVFELDGELSGMMIASLPEMASSFILPRRVLVRVYNEILKTGSVKHNKIGVMTKSEHDFINGQRIVVSKVVPGSEAEKIGICVDDVIKTVAGQKIQYREDFYNSVFFAEGSDIIDVVVERDGNELSFRVKIEYVTD